jgi:hypothetical protein
MWGGIPFFNLQKQLIWSQIYIYNISLLSLKT